MAGVLKRLVGIFSASREAEHGTARVDREPTSTPQARSTDTVVDHGENWRPKCRVCGSSNLRPDHGGFYYDAVDRYGRPLCCLDHGQ